MRKSWSRLVRICTDERNKMYDCTKEVLEHRKRVSFWLHWLAIDVLQARAKTHDESKLHPPEKEIFDEFTPKLKEYEFGSDEYKSALKSMGGGLGHHYANNRHHPEYFENGVDDMTIWDFVEMLADWMAAASQKDSHIDLDYLADRFNLSGQIVNIIRNTLKEADFDDATLHIPPQFAPKKQFLK